MGQKWLWNLVLILRSLDEDTWHSMTPAQTWQEVSQTPSHGGKLLPKCLMVAFFTSRTRRLLSHHRCVAEIMDPIPSTETPKSPAPNGLMPRTNGSGSLVRPRSAYRGWRQLHDTRAKKRAGSRGTGSAHHGNHLFHKHSLETAAPLRAASTFSAPLKLGPTSSPLSASVCDPHLCKASVRASPGRLQRLVNVQF